MKKYAGRVYVMATEHPNVVKVGFSVDPENRCKQLALKGVCHSSSPFANAAKIERAAHDLLALAGKRVKGELFYATVEEAIAAIQRAAEMVGPIPLDDDYAPASRFKQINVRLDDHDEQVLDEIRRLEPDLPDRSKMIRRLIHERANKITAAGKEKKHRAAAP